MPRVEQRTNVPTQAILLAVVGIAAAVICGHKAGFAITAIVCAGVMLWVGLALPYRLRVREPRDVSRRELDRLAFRSALLGFLSVLLAGVVIWQEPRFHGLLLSSGAAAFGAALVVLIFTAILTSSMVDWYLILPWAFGLFRGCSPIWETGDEAPDLDKDRRRWFAQVWVFHRGICELVVFTSIALLLAIGLVALGNALSSDKTLPTAFESLGGAGVAVGIFGYLGPRLRYGMNFMLAGPLGLGAWVESTDVVERHFAGFVIDVSIHPGVKLVNESGDRFFIPLGITHNVSEVNPLPAGITTAWRKEMIEHHLGRDALKPTRESLRARLVKRFKALLGAGNSEE
jgi:hypothetical protein